MVPQISGYEIVAEIGRGGMATVYKALQPSLKRYVALKVLPPYFAHDEEFVARFKHEALAVAKLRHPNIVQVYDFHEEEQWLYLAMEYVPGGSLKEWLSKEKRLSLKAAVKIVMEVAQALHHAHEKGFIHRDIKPSNILLGEEKQAIISDFGIVKALEGTNLTRNASINIIGTSEYMSPEQAQGDKVDRRSDIYSLGVVFYEMLTGLPPFVAQSPVSVIHQQIYEPPRPLREINQDVPEELELIILKLLNKNPNFRFPDCLSLVKTLAPLSKELEKLPPAGKPDKQLFRLPPVTLLKAKPEKTFLKAKGKESAATALKQKPPAKKEQQKTEPPKSSARPAGFVFLQAALVFFFFLAVAVSAWLYYQSYTAPTFIYQFKPWQLKNAVAERQLSWSKKQQKLTVQLKVVNISKKRVRLVLREVLPAALSLNNLQFSPKPQIKAKVAIWTLLLKPQRPKLLSYFTVKPTLTKKQFVALIKSYPPLQAVGLVIKPSRLVLNDGQQEQFTAWLLMNDLSLKKLNTVQTKVADRAFAEVKKFTVLGKKPGKTVLTVQEQKWQKDITVIVRPVPVSLIITPVEASGQEVGQTLQLQAELVYSDGARQTVAPRWLLSSGVQAELTSSGLLKGLAPGAVTVKAVYQKFAAFKEITFTTPIVKNSPAPKPQQPARKASEVVPLPPLVQ